VTVRLQFGYGVFALPTGKPFINQVLAGLLNRSERGALGQPGVFSIFKIMESPTTVETPGAALPEPAMERLWSRWRFRIFTASWVLYAAYYFCRKNFSVIMPMMARTEHYDNFDLAHLVFVFSLAYAGGQFLAGWLSDRFGGRFTGAAGGFVSAICTAGMAFAGSHEALLLLQIGNGLGQGCGWSAIMKVLGAWYARKERGTVMAWWGTCYVLGGFLATVFATFAATQMFVTPSMGWRNGFLFPSMILAAGAAWFAYRTRNSPQEEALPAIVEQVDASLQNGGKWEAVRSPEVWILAGMYFFLKITRYSLLFWLPLYLVQRMQYSEQAAGYTSSLFELVGFCGTLIAGYVSDRLLNGRRYPVGATMLFLLAAALLIHPVVGRLGPFAMAASISLLGILIHGPDLLMSGPAAVESVSPGNAARAVGIVNGIGSLGQLVSAYVVAIIVSRFGWDQLFTFFVLCSVAAGGLLTLRWNKGLEEERTS
jgi:sugar phosphate permease